MAITISVRSEISASENCSRSDWKTASGTPSGPSVVTASVQARTARSRGEKRVDSRQITR